MERCTVWWQCVILILVCLNVCFCILCFSVLLCVITDTVHMNEGRAAGFFSQAWGQSVKFLRASRRLFNFVSLSRQSAELTGTHLSCLSVLRRKKCFHQQQTETKLFIRLRFIRLNHLLSIEREIELNLWIVLSDSAVFSEDCGIRVQSWLLPSGHRQSFSSERLEGGLWRGGQPLLLTSRLF